MSYFLSCQSWPIILHTLHQHQMRSCSSILHSTVLSPCHCSGCPQYLRLCPLPLASFPSPKSLCLDLLLSRPDQGSLLATPITSFSYLYFYFSQEIERERKWLLTLHFYLLVASVNGFGGKKKSETIGSNDVPK